MTDRETYVYQAALAGDLDYSEVNTSGDAEWATNGYRERADNEALPFDERKFAFDFILNLASDFGDA
jgi:hypothetical protein